jgi:hypothetical protein
MVLLSAVASAVGVLVVTLRVTESPAKKAARLELKRKKELRALTENILAYARRVRQQFPTGDVVVSEHDLAQQLRKRTDAVAKALDVLLTENKVQRAPLAGYWKLKT